MQTLEQLNLQFQINNRIYFAEHDNGQQYVIMNHRGHQSRLYLQGAHVTHWQPDTEKYPVLWCSKAARYEPGKSIRGGIPVCWPWFGAHPDSPELPAHGFARTSQWEVLRTTLKPDGYAQIILKLEISEQHHPLLPAGTELRLTVTSGPTLRLELRTLNHSDQELTLTEALHTYFQISDISLVRVSGLEGIDYWDKVTDNRILQQGLIEFEAETDRVYLNSANSIVLQDSGLQRMIKIKKSGSLSTVVWTPWQHKANAMNDMGDSDDWRSMLCIESANARDNTITIAAGDEHTLTTEYEVIRNQTKQADQPS